MKKDVCFNGVLKINDYNEQQTSDSSIHTTDSQDILEERFDINGMMKRQQEFLCKLFSFFECMLIHYTQTWSVGIKTNYTKTQIVQFQFIWREVVF